MRDIDKCGVQTMDGFTSYLHIISSMSFLFNERHSLGSSCALLLQIKCNRVDMRFYSSHCIFILFRSLSPCVCVCVFVWASFAKHPKNWCFLWYNYVDGEMIHTHISYVKQISFSFSRRKQRESHSNVTFPFDCFFVVLILFMRLNVRIA